ncbi:MAG: LysR family transcriptional regulator [Minicystis sp.]
MDGFGEIGVFVRVVEARSFTRAGKRLGLTASGVSRVITRLEARLGVRLLDRTTRSIGLTAEGAAYFERCVKLVRDLEEADAAIAQGHGVPQGRLRVEAPTVIGNHVLGPALPRFLAKYPGVSLDFSTRDHVIDPVAEGIDVVIRMAELRDSDLVHKTIGSLRLLTVASPRYLAAHGEPAHPRDLRDHETLGFLTSPTPLPWRFREGDEEIVFVPSGKLRTNSAAAIFAGLEAGTGVSQLLECYVEGPIARGELRPLLGDYEPAPRPVNALFAREKAALPKVRAFLEFAESAFRSAGRASRRRLDVR